MELAQIIWVRKMNETPQVSRHDFLVALDNYKDQLTPEEYTDFKIDLETGYFTTVQQFTHHIDLYLKDDVEAEPEWWGHHYIPEWIIDLL